MDAKVGKHRDPPGETHPGPLSLALLGDLLRVFDLGVIVSSGLGIYFAYVFPGAPETLGRYLMVLLIAGVLAGLTFQRFGVYGGDHLFSNRLRLDRMISAWAMTVTALLAIAFTLKVSDQFSRVWTVSWFCCSAGALTLGRLILSRWISGQVHLGGFACRTVIVGTGEQACRLATHLNQNDRIRTHIIGFVQNNESPGQHQVPENEVLGGLDDLISLIRESSVDQVFVALPPGDVDRIRDTVHRLAATPIAIRLAPDLTVYDFMDRSFTRVAGLPVLRLFDRPISGWSRLCKAIEDRGLAILFLVVLSPLLLLIGLLIKLDSPGPALFKQKRYGFNDQLIEVWKFRTMYSHLGDADAKVLTKKDDLRVTRVGRLLRRTSLDELPQLVNVLTGKMSIVGPRPHALAAKAGGRLYYEAVEHYGARHKVKPGITGWAQINGWRGETDTVGKIRKRVEFDLYYIDHWSVWLDLVIIARTLLVPFKDDKAY